MKQMFLSMHNRQISLYAHLFIHWSALLSVANLALLSTNITKSTSVPSVASAFMSSQPVGLETAAG